MTNGILVPFRTASGETAFFFQRQPGKFPDLLQELSGNLGAGGEAAGMGELKGRRLTLLLVFLTLSSFKVPETLQAKTF